MDEDEKEKDNNSSIEYNENDDNTIKEDSYIDETNGRSEINDGKTTNQEENEETIEFNDEDFQEFMKEYEDDPKNLISTLLNYIQSRDKEIENLKKKNEELMKNNTNSNLKVKALSYVGLKKNVSMVIRNDKNVQMAEILNERDELKKINENLLSMITDKELENEKLLEKIGNYENGLKEEYSKHEKQVDSLENELDKKDEDFQNKIEELMDEYQIYKYKMDEKFYSRTRKIKI